MATKYISANEVKRHNTRRSIWIVIRNEVYDVTAYLNEHPGGEDPLLDAAGQDGTIAFEDVGHSPDARELLKKYRVGTLAPGEGCCKMKPKIWRSSSQYHRECTECDASRRGRPCRPTPPPPQQGSRLKWALLALGIAIIAGVVYKKYAGGS